MPFPYLQPIQPWAVEVLEEREDNKLLSVYRNPFIVITSGAKVVKTNGKIAAPKSEERAKEINDILQKNAPEKGIWRGCVIANSIGTHVDGLKPQELQDLTYSLNETPVGIDFDGQIIKVEGETGRKVSMPIIESMDIDTDGANNTLKTAKITVRCFTLKQLEMFEMFFLKPGMNVLVEFGDNTLETKQRPGVIGNPVIPGQTRTDKKQRNAFIDGKEVPIDPYKKISEAFVEKKQYKEFCENFSKYFRSDVDAISKYLETIRRSFGSYDRIAGKVLDYSYSINDDATYTVNFEVSQGNQIAFSVPKNPGSTTSVQKSGKPKNVEFTSYDTILTQIAADFNLVKDNLTKILSTYSKQTATGKWEDEFFNFLKINKEQKDTVASDRAYISLRFVLIILMNYIKEFKGTDTDPFFLLDTTKYRKSPTDDDKSAISIIPIQNSKFLISSDESVIYPREKLPTPTAPKKDDAKDSGEVFLNTGSFINGKINGINFDTEYTSLYQLKGYGVPDTEIKIADNVPFGNALNIFLDYRKIVEFWNKSYTRMDFLEKVLGLVNDNSYGLFQLVFGLQKENGQPVVMNHRWSPKEIKNQQNVKIYRFKPTTIKSTVKQFSFDFQMSNLVAGMTIFNTRRILAAAKEKKSSPNYTLGLPPQAYHSVDSSIFANADGWYSINQVEFETINAVKLEDEKTPNVEKQEEKKEEATKEATDLNDVIKGKSIKFVINQNTNEDDLRTLIYLHKELIQNNIKISEKSRSVVSPISVSITIDGFSGLTCGEYFEVDGIPELYNKIGVFQITNIKHNVSKDGWTTTIEADHRILDKNPNPNQ
jgi:hypothetical protein